MLTYTHRSSWRVWCTQQTHSSVKGLPQLDVSFRSRPRSSGKALCPGIISTTCNHLLFSHWFPLLFLSTVLQPGIFHFTEVFNVTKHHLSCEQEYKISDLTPGWNQPRENCTHWTGMCNCDFQNHRNMQLHAGHVGLWDTSCLKKNGGSLVDKEALKTTAETR